MKNILSRLNTHYIVPINKLFTFIKTSIMSCYTVNYFNRIFTLVCFIEMIQLFQFMLVNLLFYQRIKFYLLIF